MGLLLYLVAVVLDAGPIALRWWIGARLGGPWLGGLLACGPLGSSLAALLSLPGGGTLTRWELGGRAPSAREQDRINLTLQPLLAQGARQPRRVFVIDQPTSGAWAVGTTLYIERGLLTSPDLPAVLVHELGHLARWDSDLVLAVRRLTFPGTLFVCHWLLTYHQIVTGHDPATGMPIYAARREAGRGSAALFFIVGLVGGGLGWLVLRPAWRVYWRQREYQADHYAAELGLALPLAEALERLLPLDLAAPWSEPRTHPHTELRIARLLAYAQGDPAPAPEWGEYAKLGLLSGLGLVVALPLLVCVFGAVVVVPAARARYDSLATASAAGAPEACGTVRVAGNLGRQQILQEPRLLAPPLVWVAEGTELTRLCPGPDNRLWVGVRTEQGDGFLPAWVLERTDAGRR